MRVPKPLDLPRLLQALTAAGVDFVVVGGLAVIAHGHERVTTDLDICYARDQNTARALLRARRSLNAQVLDDQYQPQPLPSDFRTLQRGDVFTFTTDAGELDCMTAPDGTSGYEDLVVLRQIRALVQHPSPASHPVTRAGQTPSPRPAQIPQGDRIWVPDYERADGTRVVGHWRRPHRAR